LGKTLFETLFESFKFTSKILCFVKDQRKNLRTMTMALKFAITCEALNMFVSYDESCFGHAMNKRCTMCYNNDKVLTCLELVSVKFTHATFKFR
jgi:hypothetical protein